MLIHRLKVSGLLSFGPEGIESKGRVSFELLERLSPTAVEAACPHAKALLDRLRSL